MRLYHINPYGYSNTNDEWQWYKAWSKTAASIMPWAVFFQWCVLEATYSIQLRGWCCLPRHDQRISDNKLIRKMVPRAYKSNANKTKQNERWPTAAQADAASVYKVKAGKGRMQIRMVLTFEDRICLSRCFAKTSLSYSASLFTSQIPTIGWRLPEHALGCDIAFRMFPAPPRPVEST